MKKHKKLLSLGLTVALVSVTSATAFASESEKPAYDESTIQMDVKANEPQSRGASLGSNGDILVSLVINSGSVGFAGHAAIVSSNSTRTIESFAKSFSPIDKDGVQYYNNTWGTNSGALLVRPYNAMSANYTTASSFAAKQVGKPYNWVFTDKNTTDKFYCSQLV